MLDELDIYSTSEGTGENSDLEDQIDSLFDSPGIDLPVQKFDTWEQIFDIKTVDPEYQSMVACLLNKYPDAYNKGPLDIGQLKDPSMNLSIEVTELPRKQKTYPIAPPLLPATRKIIYELVEAGVLKEGIGPCSTPCFLVAKNSNEKNKLQKMKKDGDYDVDKIKWRFICDFRELNRVTIEKFSGLSCVSHVHNVLKGKRFVTMLDISSSFYQIPLAKESQFLTQISLDGGLGSFHFLRAPMGLCTSPCALQSIMSKIFHPKYQRPDGTMEVRPLCEDKLAFYMDDILACADTAEEMFDVLDKLFARLSDVGFKISIQKAEFFQKDKKVELLGFLVDKEGIQITEKKLETASQMVRPKTVKELQKVLGFFNYLSAHVPNFQTLACALTDQLNKARGAIEWNPEMEKSFQDLKNSVLKNLKLYHIEYDQPLYLQCDASMCAMGLCLLQFINNEVRIIKFHSIKFPATVRQKYSIVVKEALAVIMGLSKFRMELEAVRERVVITDSTAIVFILSGGRAGNNRLARLAMTMLAMPFKVIIKHRRGEDNLLPDVLSRFFHKTKPHLKLKDPYTLERDDLKSLGLKEGDITTSHSIHERVNNDSAFVLPFLKNEEEGNLIEELFTIDMSRHIHLTPPWKQKRVARHSNPCLNSRRFAWKEYL